MRADVRSGLVVGALALAVSGCGADGGPAAPEPGPDPDPDPATGAVEVSTATSGAEPDPDGYVLRLVGEGEERAIGVDDTVVVADLAEGDHTVELSDVASRCALPEGENPRSVTVSAADTASVGFEVDCEGASTIRVRTSTVAGGLDEDGFRVTVDGGEARTIAPDDTVTITGVASGDRSVELTGLAAECSLSGDALREVTVAAGETAEVDFRGRCGLRDRIVFWSGRDGSDLWVMEADGANPRRIVDTPDGVRMPAVSPDGSLVAFQFGDPADIWVMEADGTDFRNLTRDDARDRHPSWSPDGARVAYETSRPGTDIAIVDVDGLTRERLVGHSAFDGDPAWSPDGSHVAFESDRDGNREIYVVAVEGFEPPVRLTEHAAPDENPAWSPDGTKILFSSDRTDDADSNEQIWEVCANGANAPENLTEDDSRDHEAPAWSPDGSRIAFDSGLDVWVMEADGSNPFNLTRREEATDRRPVWSPQTSSGPGPGPGPDPSQECRVAAP